jgi:hypothetical protein
VLENTRFSGVSALRGTSMATERTLLAKVLSRVDEPETDDSVSSFSRVDAAGSTLPLASMDTTFAFLTNTDSRLDEPDDPVTAGSRVLVLAVHVGSASDIRWASLATSRAFLTNFSRAAEAEAEASSEPPPVLRWTMLPNRWPLPLPRRLCTHRPARWRRNTS